MSACEEVGELGELGRRVCLPDESSLSPIPDGWRGWSPSNSLLKRQKPAHDLFVRALHMPNGLNPSIPPSTIHHLTRAVRSIPFHGRRKHAHAPAR